MGVNSFINLHQSFYVENNMILRIIVFLAVITLSIRWLKDMEKLKVISICLEF